MFVSKGWGWAGRLIWPDLIRDYDMVILLVVDGAMVPCLIWPDLIRDYDACPSSHAAQAWESSLIWPDLIRDYDRSPCWFCSVRGNSQFDMTWLDKGLRRIWNLEQSWSDFSMFDMTWLDKGLRRGSPRDRAPGDPPFDMTWLDKGLRRPRSCASRSLASCLIWPDLIRDYDFHFLICEKLLSFRLIWPDLIRDYDDTSKKLS